MCAFLLMAASQAQALIMVGKGNRPVQDLNWRAGAVDLANLKCRVGWWEGPPFGGGMWTFLYRGDTDTFNQALETFAKVRAPSLELVVCDGPAESPFLRDDTAPKADVGYDWDFRIWDVQSYYKLYGNPTSTFMSDEPDFRRPLPAPRITVFIDGGGGVQWDKVKVPKGIVVIDKRASAAGIKPGQGAVIAGNIFDMATSKPLADAKITIELAKANKSARQGIEYETVATTRSDADGRFRIEKLPAGTYRVCVSADGYAPMLVGYSHLVKDGYLAFDDVELSPRAAVSGSVVDDAGKPIAGALVRLDDTMGVNGVSYRLPATAEATTDANGCFDITDVPNGYGRLICFPKGYHIKVGELQPVPAKDLVLRASRTGTIRGKVIGGGKNLGEVNVSVEPQGGIKVGSWGGATKVKPDGTFEFDNVPPGTYIISTRPLIPGQPPDPNAKTIEVKAGQTVTVELQTAPANGF
jgi:hypothetical protein